MTPTPELIDRLAADLAPMPRGFFGRRLALAIAGGSLLAFAIVLIAWGLRPDLASAPTTSPFWVKWGYSGILAVTALLALRRLAYPDLAMRAYGWLLLAVPVAATAALAIAELMAASPGDHYRLTMGATSATCPWLIALLALPLTGALLWATRAMAPTHLRLAGAMAGLAAGGLAAFVYALGCDESAMPFVFIWYGLGMLVPALIGAALGRAVLRW